MSYNPEYMIDEEELARFEKQRAEEALHAKHKTRHGRRAERIQKVGRNDKCPCGSERKFKNCCLVFHQPPHGTR